MSKKQKHVPKKISVTPPTALHRRAAGILCHVSSLPGPRFNGDLTFQACQTFIDWLRDAGQSYWQVLPLNPIGAGNSPYSSVCSFAGDPLFVSLDDLIRDGLLSKDDLRPLPKTSSTNRVNYKRARQHRMKLLRKAFLQFNTTSDYKKFCAAHADWLEDFSLFCALSDHFETTQWHLWPKALRQRQSAAMTRALQDLADDIEFHKFGQYLFFRQWAKVKDYANKAGIKIIGDIPIFVSHESSDVWGSQADFFLKPDGSPKFIAGVPPDYFNRDGQLWGNALFDWAHMKNDGFSWWLKRLNHMTDMFDIVRLDHFIGFYRYWEIRAGAKDAKKGTWRLAEGDALLKTYLETYGALPFIAEDLGIVTAEVTALREKYNLPAMKVMQLAFGNDDSAPGHLPHHFTSDNCVVYTGTHDNDTTAGWYNSARKASKSLNPSYDFPRMKAYSDKTEAPHWAFTADIYKSIARLAVIPLQDALGLGTAARMNVPGTIGKNWDWRAERKHLTQSLAKSLCALAKATDRL